MQIPFIPSAAIQFKNIYFKDNVIKDTDQIPFQRAVRI